MFTRHEHWLKDAADVQPITDPMLAWKEQLSAKQQKMLEERTIPALFVVGLMTVLVPDILLEVRLRARDRRSARQAVQGGGTDAPPGSPIGGYGIPAGAGLPGVSANGTGEAERDASRPPPLPGIPF